MWYLPGARPSSRAEWNRDPLTVLIHISIRTFDRKAPRELRIVLQEPVDGRVVARYHVPGSAFTNHVLLHHEFAVRIERFGNVCVHYRVGNGKVARNANRTNLDPLKLENSLTALQAIHESISRQTRSR